ncbi:MAG: exodeoxyribonuclease VII small subunit [Pseudomonadota bacterium]
MAKKKTEPDFESSLQELESLVTKLESGDLSLEDSLAAFEQGINLTRECQQHLTNAEQKVSLLIGEGDELEQVDFDKDE